MMFVPGVDGLNQSNHLALSKILSMFAGGRPRAGPAQAVISSRALVRPAVRDPVLHDASAWRSPAVQTGQVTCHGPSRLIWSSLFLSIVRLDTPQRASERGNGRFRRSLITSDEGRLAGMREGRKSTLSEVYQPDPEPWTVPDTITRAGALSSFGIEGRPSRSRGRYSSRTGIIVSEGNGDGHPGTR